MAKVLTIVGTALALAIPFVGPVVGVALAVASLAANIAAQSLGQKKRVTPRTYSWAANPNDGVPWAFGRIGVGGNVVYRREHGSDNRWQSVVTTFGLGPIDAIEPQLLVENEAVSFSGAKEATGFYVGHLWWDKQLGLTPEAAALNVPAAAGSALPGWTSAHKLSGLAADIVTMKLDKSNKKYPNGTPKIRRVLKGAKVYDPRADSTFSGGSGAHRINDPTTWAWSDNPWLLCLAWALGRYQNGVRVAGVGLSPASIDIASFAYAASVAGANGWTCAGVVSTELNKWEVTKAFARAGGGRPVRAAGVLSARVNAPAAALYTIRKADLVSEGRVPATRTRRERFNAAQIQYLSEDHDWQVVDAQALDVPEYAAEDGGRRTRSLVYEITPTVGAATKLAAYEIADARELRPIALALKPRFFAFVPGDVLECDEDLTEAGLGGKLLKVTARSIDPASGAVTMFFETETPEKHAFALGQAGGAPPAPALRGRLPELVDPAPGSWTLSAVMVTGVGHETPALRFEAVSPVPDGTAAILFEYRIVGETDWLDPGSTGAEVTSRQVTGVASMTSYEGRIRYRDRYGRISGTLTFGPVTTGRAVDVSAIIAASRTTLGAGAITSVWVAVDGVARVTVPAHMRIYADKAPAAVSSGTFDVAEGATIRIYYDDPARSGGAVSYGFTETAADAYPSLTYPYRHFVGLIVAATSGGGGTGGGPIP